jgi:hypothetical protein
MGFEADHVNHDPLDNRSANLRVVSHRENMIHQRKRRACVSNFKGVTFHDGSWRARVVVDGKETHSTRHRSEEDAARAYDAAARIAFGEFAVVNFP